jgi:cellulose synthase (UDP-forming)
MTFKPITIQKPTRKEKTVLRLMIIAGVFSVFFFLYTMLQGDNIGYRPLYVMLMTTLIYYCLKFLHEWYHYFSISADEKPIADKTYTVDIFTTYCAGEPFSMLEETLEAMQNIKYPHTSWCGDESNDPLVEALCDRLNVKYITRTDKKDAKAGNINNALQFATGELAIVLDPDHIPCPEFLDYVVPYFNDPKIGFVQVVQAYYNQHDSLVAKGAAQQTYQFYGPMMMSMHSYGTVQAIGANCTFRRSALDTIGGHASGLAEDMHTSMKLHAKGWKSIYVPAILTRGLVPATLSSYYKQQLKWSRGTWELLLAIYPKLFTKFTWRQKLHYLTLPLHFLAGIIFFINFLIPVIALFTGYIPLQMDLLSFVLAGFPVSAMSLFIRHYVQKWVAEERERGFHMVGGILLIGTWWILSIGVIYTLLRKKVPYIPTPKNDRDILPMSLSLPNIFVLLVSLAAIVYGLWHGHNPYTFFMVALAFIQVCFMLFILFVSGYIKKGSSFHVFSRKIRRHSWLVTKAHDFIRRYSVVLSFLVIATFVFGYIKHIQLPTFLPKLMPELQVFYAGIYAPSTNDGLTKLANVFTEGNRGKNNFSVVSFYLSPNAGGKINLPQESIFRVYNNNAVPLISLSLSSHNVSRQESNNDFFKNITAGKYDSLITAFALHAGGFNKPMFLKLMLFNASSTTVDSVDANLFISAWRYVHNIVDAAGASKLIWVWNHPNAATAVDFFPGKKYVDWLGVTVLDLALPKADRTITTFDSLYRPYHSSFIFKLGFPVMITEGATLSANKKKWWKDAWNNIDSAFKEIKSVVFYNAKFSNNTNKTWQADWTTDVHMLLKNLPATNIPKITLRIQEPVTSSQATSYTWPDSMKAVLYDKGFIWFRNKHTLTQKTMEEDVQQMKAIGINTIERTMPGFYDKPLAAVFSSNNMQLISRFGMLTSPLLLDDEKQLNNEKEKVLRLVKNNVADKNIIAWNLGEDGLFSLENQTYKPDYFYYSYKYITWLSQLCDEIRLLDTVRPIVIDLNWDVNGKKRWQLYNKHVPGISTFLLVADSRNKPGLIDTLSPGMAWGKVPVHLWDSLPAIKKSGMIPAWQDIATTDFIILNGLLDLEGRKKDLYRKVVNTWSSARLPLSPIPEIKVLRPLKTTRVNTKLEYRLMYKHNGKWKLFNEDEKRFRFEWHLVRTDQYGTTMFIKKVGDEPILILSIPDEPQYYQLYVETISGDDIKVITSTLNTPLE